jgi:NADH-quinone oxidoreductase subunit E
LEKAVRKKGVEEKSMLFEKEKKAIEAILHHPSEKRIHSLQALKILQQHRGFVPDEAVRDIAALLEMTAEELDAIATFYPFIFRRPVGRHVIYICDSVSCWVMGYENIFDRISGSLGIGMGQTTSDSRFTLLPVSCIGACDRAPAMMIDEELYGDLSPEKIDAILEKYR